MRRLPDRDEAGQLKDDDCRSQSSLTEWGLRLFIGGVFFGIAIGLLLFRGLR